MTISESSSFELSPQDRCSTYRELTNTFRFLPITLWLSAILRLGGARFAILSRGKVYQDKLGTVEGLEGQFTDINQRIPASTCVV